MYTKQAALPSVTPPADAAGAAGCDYEETHPRMQKIAGEFKPNFSVYTQKIINCCQKQPTILHGAGPHLTDTMLTSSLMRNP